MRASEISASASPPLTAATLLTAAQVADRWQTTTGHVYGLVRSGALPAVKLGPRLVRFRVEAIEDWERNGGADA